MFQQNQQNGMLVKSDLKVPSWVSTIISITGSYKKKMHRKQNACGGTEKDSSSDSSVLPFLSSLTRNSLDDMLWRVQNYSSLNNSLL